MASRVPLNGFNFIFSVLYLDFFLSQNSHVGWLLCTSHLVFKQLHIHSNYAATSHTPSTQLLPVVNSLPLQSFHIHLLHYYCRELSERFVGSLCTQIFIICAESQIERGVAKNWSGAHMGYWCCRQWWLCLLYHCIYICLYICMHVTCNYRCGSRETEQDGHFREKR